VKIDPTAFKDITSDVEFASLLVEEESVVVLPGKQNYSNLKITVK